MRLKLQGIKCHFEKHDRAESGEVHKKFKAAEMERCGEDITIKLYSFTKEVSR